MADIPFPLGSKTVSLPQLKLLSSDSLQTYPAFDVLAWTTQKTPLLCCSDGTAIGADHAENTITLLLFAGYYLATADVYFIIMHLLNSSGSTCHNN
jgi:hypothetical protein